MEKLEVQVLPNGERAISGAILVTSAMELLMRLAFLGKILLEARQQAEMEDGDEMALRLDGPSKKLFNDIFASAGKLHDAIQCTCEACNPGSTKSNPLAGMDMQGRA